MADSSRSLEPVLGLRSDWDSPESLPTCLPRFQGSRFPKKIETRREIGTKYGRKKETFLEGEKKIPLQFCEILKWSQTNSQTKILTYASKNRIHINYPVTNSMLEIIK